MRIAARSLAVLILAPALASCARSSGEAHGAAAAEIVCEADVTRVLTPVVSVNPDGVHLRVDNRAGAPRYVYKQVDETSASNLHQAPPGASETVSGEAPGVWSVICSPPDVYPMEGSEWVGLEVVDPEDVWLADRPDCEHPTGTHPDYVEYFEGGLPKGEPRDPLELARKQLPEEFPGWRQGDEVEPAGYPESSPRKVRVMRGEQVVAVASYRDDERGGWFFGDISYCDEGGGGRPEPPD